jgi:aminopeptidase YwaD
LKPSTLALLALAACQSSSLSTLRIDQAEGYRRGLHVGPEVFFVSGAGTARFAPVLLAELDVDAAMETLLAIDAHYREPANEGYDVAIDRVLAGLRSAGFGAEEGFELRVDERPLGHLSWTPRRATLVLHMDDALPQVLHRFDAPGEQDRCMLPTNAPSADVRGPVALRAEDLVEGGILVTDEPVDRAVRTAREHGAAGVISTGLFGFSVDPTGAERHLDAIRYSRVSVGTELPCAQISQRAYERIKRAAGAGRCELHLSAGVSLAERPLRTVVATVVGAERPQEVVTLMAHVQEPGANDNASGVAGLLECARALRRVISEGALPAPRRSVAFVWGDEYRASHIFLETTQRRPIAAVSVDMIGASREKTGAVCLLERGPDPGALTPLPPDEHTPWGAATVNPNTLIPSGLAVVLRCAMIDVGIEVGGWETSEHPWEGGSDHDVFLNAGVPAALMWHFTDFTYHTSLDRPDMVDPEELRRTSAALVVGALGVADARPGDLRRYVESALAEGEERAGAVELEGAPLEVAQQWVDWYHGTRLWFSALCAGEPLPDRYEAR